MNRLIRILRRHRFSSWFLRINNKWTFFCLITDAVEWDALVVFTETVMTRFWKSEKVFSMLLRLMLQFTVIYDDVIFMNFSSVMTMWLHVAHSPFQGLGRCPISWDFVGAVRTSWSGCPSWRPLRLSRAWTWHLMLEIPSTTHWATSAPFFIWYGRASSPKRNINSCQYW